MPRRGTRRASSRASSTARPRRRACSASGFPEEYGGTPADYFFRIVSAEEFARAGTGGLSASLFSHTIGAPPIAAVGSEELKRRVLPSILVGREDQRAGDHRAERRV